MRNQTQTEREGERERERQTERERERNRKQRTFSAIVAATSVRLPQPWLEERRRENKGSEQSNPAEEAVAASHERKNYSH